MHGTSFCRSARSVFELMARNPVSVFVIDVISEFVLFVGKVCGTALIVFLTVVFLRITQPDAPIGAITITASIVISYFIFNMYSKVISTGIDATFVAYLEDLERVNIGMQMCATDELHQLIQDRQVVAMPTQNEQEIA